MFDSFWATETARDRAKKIVEDTHDLTKGNPPTAVSDTADGLLLHWSAPPRVVVLRISADGRYTWNYANVDVGPYRTPGRAASDASLGQFYSDLAKLEWPAPVPFIYKVLHWAMIVFALVALLWASVQAADPPFSELERSPENEFCYSLCAPAAPSHIDVDAAGVRFCRCQEP